MKKRIALTTILLLLAAVLSAASIISAPAATVNLIHNTAITTDELDKEAARYEAMGVQGISKLDILQSLINNEVLMQGAERDGIVISDRQLDSLYATAKANVEAQAGMAISDADFEAEVINQFGSVDEYKLLLSSISCRRKAQSFRMSRHRTRVRSSLSIDRISRDSSSQRM